MTTVPRCPIERLNPAEIINQVFLISQPQLRTTSRGDYYIAAYLSDATGRLNARMWQATEEIYQSLPEEGFVMVKGRTEMYQNSLQMVVEAIRPIERDEVDLSEFLPTTKNDIPAMWNRLLEILGTIKNPHLIRLIKAFLGDQHLMQLYRDAPAAIALHHAYIGGLLEHTLTLLELGQRIIPLYPEINGDLVLTGLFLHDIGKTNELDFDISFKYSDQGRLMGHLVKGAIMIEEKVKQLNDEKTERFPRTLADCLIHIIVSHHGIREFGCPILPATPEAYMVHFLDNLDSKMALTLTEIKNDSNMSSWTNYIKSLDTPLFKQHNSF